MTSAPSGRRPRRLFVEQIAAEGDVQPLSTEAAQHIRVLRLSAGDGVELFDARGQCARAELLPPGGSGPSVRVGAHRELPEPTARLVLVSCVPKGNKLDPIVRMLTELGVSELRLCHSERTVGGRDALPATRLDRWQRIAREACAQSGRPHTLRIEAPGALPDVAARAPDGAQRLLFWEHADAPLGPLSELADGGGEVWAVVGPEGGLTDGEAQALQAQGYRSVGLGPTILRAETALIASATLILDRIGRLR